MFQFLRNNPYISFKSFFFQVKLPILACNHPGKVKILISKMVFMKKTFLLNSLACLLIISSIHAQDVHIRINQVGYLPDDHKEAIVFSNQAVNEPFELLGKNDASKIQTLQPEKVDVPGWRTFSHYYTIDFSLIRQAGEYILKGCHSETISSPITISPDTYTSLPDTLLGFMRQQRCGYNPFLDMVCHQQDGRSFYSPLPDSIFVDLSGGWHDAGDQLKYLITGSYATAHILKAYQLFPDKFGDQINTLGQSYPNDLPDVLDEAKWGLDWIHKMHPRPDHLYHQVADDRDHIGWKMPNRDSSDYGWGPNSYRAAYFANGEPQGLREYKSEATGLANLAGRSAVSMAIAARIWNKENRDEAFAEKCLQAAQSLYQMGKENEGFQQGNSYGAPYRYNERTWSDDMEWAAAELYETTGKESYLEDAIHYARMTNTQSWMNRDTMEHYEYYPFVNMGHFALYQHVDEALQDTLAGYYRNGIEYTMTRGHRNPYSIGVPFIWCSNNLLTGLITKIILYQRMTGDKQYEDFLHKQRDWLFGRNPWGTSMFTGIPEDGEYPVDVHTSTWALTKREVAGGLVDGPVYRSIYNSLKGLQLVESDEFAPFQNNHVVYHDDIGDYSTNEPTMDGTAGAILMMAYWAGEIRQQKIEK